MSFTFQNNKGIPKRHSKLLLGEALINLKGAVCMLSKSPIEITKN